MDPSTNSEPAALDDPVLTSPPDTGSDSGSDSASSGSGSSVATIEDIDVYPSWGLGHPLERMIRLEVAEDDEEEEEEEEDEPGLGSVSRQLSRYSSCDSEAESEASYTSSVVYDIDFEALVDDLVEKDGELCDSRNLIMIEPSTPTSNDSVMIKCLPRTSSELLILLELNHPEHRHDPWNPAPHILCAVEREDTIFVCMQPLLEFNRPPFRTVANYIDFFRQCLEGLTFLHEHKIAQLSCLDPTAFMVDIGTASSAPSSVESFNRALYPVKYYFTNLSRASKNHSAEYFINDVKECGEMFDRLLVNVPPIAPKLKTLVKSMTSGGFGADNARKLFEAMCKSLESAVFDMPVIESDTGLSSISSTPSTSSGSSNSSSSSLGSNLGGIHSGGMMASEFAPPMVRRSRSHPATPSYGLGMSVEGGINGVGGGLSGNGSQRVRARSRGHERSTSTATIVAPQPMVRAQSTPALK